MFRIGNGWDRHPLQEGRKCVLGGVVFSEYSRGPAGHSDGDVVCHAIIDALLGASGKGDIGRMFPDTDPRWAGADSLMLLEKAWAEVARDGFTIGNIDVVVIAEAPKISPRSSEMSLTLAGALSLSPSRISIKATRGEGLGPEGRGECITVQAVALLEEK